MKSITEAVKGCSAIRLVCRLYPEFMWSRRDRADGSGEQLSCVLIVIDEDDVTCEIIGVFLSLTHAPCLTGKVLSDFRPYLGGARQALFC